MSLLNDVMRDLPVRAHGAGSARKISIANVLHRGGHRGRAVRLRDGRKGRNGP